MASSRCVSDWPTVNNTNANRFDPSSELDAYSIKRLSEEYKVPISDLPAGVVDVYCNPSADDKYLYLTAVQSGVSNPQGLIMSICRSSGKLQWQRQMQSYSGIDGDYTQAAPAVWKDFLFFGSSIALPQTVAPYEQTMKGLFTGLPQKASGRRVRVYCVNKFTGDMVWESEVGKIATSINDPDNWLSITQSPIVVKRVVDDSGVKRPVVIIGTSSLQSYLPWLMTRGRPFIGLSWGEEYGLADGTVGHQMTDRGQVLFLNALSGATMFSTYTCPDLLVAGVTLSSASTIGAGTSTITRHTVTSADLLGGGDLNPIIPAYGVTGTITYVLELGGTIPSPLNGVNVVGATNTLVALVGGAAVTVSLNKVVVSLQATFTAGTINVTINGNPFTTTDPAVGLDGTGVGLRPVRIAKQINIGDILTAKDAYQLNFFGGSVWGNTCSVIPQNKNTLAVTVGQGHWYPYSEAVNLNAPGTTYLDLQNTIKAAQDTFIAIPTAINYQAMQQAYKNYDIGVVNQINMTKSARCNQFHISSTIGISLDKSNFGQIVWSAPVQGYDYWQIGYVLRVRSALGPGWSDVQAYYERPVGADGDSSQGPYYVERHSKVYMISFSKGGILTVHQVKSGQITEVHRQVFANSYINGASNYGSTVSGCSAYSLNSQAYDPSHISAPAPSPQNFPPQMRWYVSQDKFFDIRQSSVFRFRLSDMAITWTVPVLPNDTAPYAMTLAQISSSDHLLYIPASNGEVHIKRLSDGEDVKVINVQHGGQSSPIALDNELYIVSGRGGLSGSFNLGATNYSATPYLYKYSLKHKKCKDKCDDKKCKDKCDDKKCKDKCDDKKCKDKCDKGKKRDGKGKKCSTKYDRYGYRYDSSDISSSDSEY